MLPSIEDIFRIDSPNGFADLLGCADLAEATAPWWTAVISACSSCLTVAATSGADAWPIDWAMVLVSILDVAAGSGLLSPVEILSRRVRVQLSALSAGCRGFGDTSTVCVKVFEDLAHHGESVQAVSCEVGRISSGNAVSKSRAADLVKLRQIVRDLTSVRDAVSEDMARSELGLWMDALRAV